MDRKDYHTNNILYNNFDMDNVKDMEMVKVLDKDSGKSYIKNKLFNETIRDILIKNNYDENYINNLYKELEKICLFFYIVKGGENNDLVKNFEVDIFNKLNELGIGNDIINTWFNICENEFENSSSNIVNPTSSLRMVDLNGGGTSGSKDNHNNKKMETEMKDYLEKINDYFKSKDTEISNVNLNRLIKYLRMFNRINNIELTEKIIIIKENILMEIEAKSKEEYLKVKGGKTKNILLKPINYNRRFISVIRKYVEVMRNVLIEWFKEYHNN